MLFHKFCIFALVLLLIFTYIYVKKENFETNTTSPNTIADPISFQLKNEIAKVLDISPTRIYNLKYEGDIKNNILNVDFGIFAGIVTSQTEKSQYQASQKAFNLITNDTFYVTINTQPIKLRKMAVLKNDSALNDKSFYFKNEGLKTILNYTKNKYTSVPNDESLTKFYTLEFDKDYKVTPKLN